MVYIMPRTKLGKVSFWLVISSILIIFILNVISGIMSKNDICTAEGICQPAPEDLELNSTFVLFTRILPGLLAMGCVVIAGILSIVVIVKYKERAILLFLSALLGLLGSIFMLGEILTIH